jgi:hypothetical protein
MSFFSAPAQPTPQLPPAQTPAVTQQIADQQAQIAQSNAAIASKARSQFISRTMGMSGANALYTAGAAGYGRTLGNANTG